MKNIVYGIIDAENTNPIHINSVLEDLSKKVEVEPKFQNSYLKIIAIADWSNNLNAQWKKVSYKYNIECLQQFNYSKGGNSSDIAITAKVIELINKYPNKIIKGIAIISSDADFIPLIQKIKQNCIFCIGYLEKNKYKENLKEIYNEYIEYPFQIKSPSLPKFNNQIFKKAIFKNPIFIKTFREINYFLKKQYFMEEKSTFSTTDIWKELCRKTTKEEISELKTQIKNISLPNTDPKKTLSLITSFLALHSENFKKLKKNSQENCYTFECSYLFGFPEL